MALSTTRTYIWLFPYAGWAFMLPLLHAASPMVRMMLFLLWIFFGAGLACDLPLNQFARWRPMIDIILTGFDAALGPQPTYSSRILAQAVPAVTIWVIVSGFRFDHWNCWILATAYAVQLFALEWSRNFKIGNPLWTRSTVHDWTVRQQIVDEVTGHTPLPPAERSQPREGTA